jgi:hypothetical protein
MSFKQLARNNIHGRERPQKVRASTNNIKLFDRKDGGSIFLQKFGIHLPAYVM